jgi:hypothetical protein
MTKGAGMTLVAESADSLRGQAKRKFPSATLRINGGRGIVFFISN